MASFAKLGNPPRIAFDRTRAQAALVKVDEGYMLKRDPDFQNARPIGESQGMPTRAAATVWEDLARVKAPVMFLRGAKSDRWKDPKPLERLAKEFPHVLVIAVDAQHDVAGQAPKEVIAMVRKFIEQI
jgi:pimeloyl-ACP methyl ester carboxylesterase